MSTTNQSEQPPADGAFQSRIDLTGGWALTAPYTVIEDTLDLIVEHLSEGLTVTAPVGWRVHVPTHSGVRYVHIPQGWTSVVPLATPCVVLENGHTFVNLTHRETEHSPAELEISSNGGRVRLTWVFRNGEVPTFRCLQFDSWDALIEDQRQWMIEAAGVKPLSEVAPAWIAQCPLMIYLDIEAIGGKALHHSFDDVARLAEAMARAGAPPESMVYLTTWNTGFERTYPTYEPSKLAGGMDGLRRAADALHTHGYRMMLHSNVWGCSPTHPEYTRLVSHIVHNRAGHPLSWREFHRGYVSDYICVRPDARAFREVFWGSLREVVSEIKLDALYLDQAGLLVDDPNRDMLQATRVLLDDIKQDAPELVLGGQVLTSRLCDAISLWQLWGTPWSGQGWGQPFRRRSRLVADLFRGLTRFCAHTNLPAAVPGRFLWINEGFANDLGTVGCFLAAQEDNTYHDAVPSLRLNFREHGIDELSAEVLDQAARLAARP